ncbi:MAG: hypothetical protein M1836_006766 [Candelina mexicana]|nr:MAG: hypothetical protein M1836_006766 [Candelina mexicana]
MVLSGRIEKTSSAQKTGMPLKGRFEKTILVAVGGENGHKAQEFIVHKTPICFHSSFFQKACDGRWVEAAHVQVNLPEDDPAVFEVLVQWLYAQKIEEAIINDDFISTSLMLVRLYLLADKLGIPRLKNISIDTFVEMFESKKLLPTEKIIAEIWKTTMAGCPFRQVCVDLWGWSSGPKSYDSLGEVDNIGDFFCRVARILSTRHLALPKEKAPFRTSMCNYHESAQSAICSCGKKREVRSE